MRNPPAAASSGARPRSRRAGAALLCLIAGGWLLPAGCADPPIAARQAAEAALARATQAKAETGAPAFFEAATAAFRQAEIETARGDHARAECSFGIARRRADAAVRIHDRRRADGEARARRMLERARGGLTELDWLVTYLPPGSPIRPGIKRAEIATHEAGSLLNEGDATRALASARAATADIARAYQRIESFLLGGQDPERRGRYRRWVEATIAESRRSGQPAIIVDKMRRTVTLVSGGRRTHTYRAELGINGTLMKVVAGDRATPEGRYRVTEKRGPNQTKWYKALMLNYPNEEDLKRFHQARRRGEIPRNASPGSLIEIHGKGGRGGDWTDGCVALSNADMDHLFARVAVGTPVTIVGFEVAEEDRAPDRSSHGTAGP